MKHHHGIFDEDESFSVQQLFGEDGSRNPKIYIRHLIHQDEVRFNRIEDAYQLYLRMVFVDLQVLLCRMMQPPVVRRSNANFESRDINRCL